MKPSPTEIAFSIVVANWNGEAWIERALSSIQIAARAARVPAEIVVVDDASADSSPDAIRSRFPRVRLLRNSKNVGFARTVNRGVRAARGPLVVLLNNDLVVREDFFARLLAPFQSAAGGGTSEAGRNPSESAYTNHSMISGGRPCDLFAVSARTLSWDGMEPNHLCMAAVFHEGRIQPAWSAPSSATPCLFAQGGAMACRRDVYLALGGFDPLFAPGYWEDYDLCWRAARAGFEIRYEPRAVAFHVGGGSMTRRYGAREVYLLRIRNHLLFEWMNIQDKKILIRHAAWLSRHVFREWLRGEGFGFTKALGRAARMLPSVLRARRRRLDSGAALSDRRLLAIGRSFTRAPTP